MDFFSKENIKSYGKSMELSFSDTLRAMLLEELMYRLLSETKPVQFVLEAKGIFGKEAYSLRREQAIVLYVKDELTSAAAELKKRIETSEGQPSISVQNQAESGGSLRITVMASLEEMKIPFVLELCTVKAELLYLQQESYLGIGRKQALSYAVCAPEQRLSENLWKIFDHLELIGDMKAYEESYRIIRQYAVNGRRVSEEIRRCWSHPHFEEKRIAIIAGYKNYKYMEKRFISYQKNKEDYKKGELIPWSETVDLIIAFSRPIFQCLDQDQVFIGDWMPELGRFI